MELDVSRNVKDLKTQLINELDGIHFAYTTYRHIGGGFSISSDLVDQLMQAAYEMGREHSFDAGWDEAKELFTLQDHL